MDSSLPAGSSPDPTASQRLAQALTKWTGTTAAFASAAGAVLVWVVMGPLFHYSDTWQLVMNTASSIVTFLMVFLIQRSQNKDALAVHVKLNEIVKAIEGASNRIVNVGTFRKKNSGDFRRATNLSPVTWGTDLRRRLDLQRVAL
jgi:low affinity Fe/Cu permease